MSNSITPLQLGVLGSTGRMGQLICQGVQCQFNSHIQLASRVRRGDALDPLLDCDVVIDVASPKAMVDLAKLALSKPAPHSLPAFLIGSTGWTLEQTQIIEKLAEKTVLLICENFSFGIYLLGEILKKISPLLLKRGYTPVLTEIHHQYKKDVPSGTALTLQKAIQPDPHAPTIQTHSLRAGRVIGTHEVTYFGPTEELHIRHQANDRSLFAQSAIEMALWLADQEPSGRILRQMDYFSQGGAP